MQGSRSPYHWSRVIENGVEYAISWMFRLDPLGSMGNWGREVSGVTETGYRITFQVLSLFDRQIYRMDVRTPEGFKQQSSDHVPKGTFGFCRICVDRGNRRAWIESDRPGTHAGPTVELGTFRFYPYAWEQPEGLGDVEKRVIGAGGV